jgi:hypothetical protein
MRITTIALFLSACLALLGSLPAAAQGPWSLAAHVGSLEIDRVVRDSGPWWADIDDRSTAMGLSVGYEMNPTLGVRLLYERASDLRSSNVCPPGATCPSIAIREEVDFTAWQLALVPRLPLTRNWSLFGTLGIMDWKLRRDNLLPTDSDTTLSYSVGFGWRTGLVELGLEYQRADVDYDGLRFSAGVRF